MNISAPFLARPIATALLAVGIALAGIVAFLHLPVSALPRVDLPTIVVTASQPGADPATMASSVAAPLERRLGAIAAVTEMTSTSSLGATSIVLQFDLSRSVQDAARDVLAAINAAGSDLPSGLPNPPLFRKANPGDAPVLILAMTSDRLKPGDIYDAVDSFAAPGLSQVPGVSQVIIAGADQPAVRVTIDPHAAKAAGVSLDDVRQAIAGANVTQPTGLLDATRQSAHVQVNDRLNDASDFGAITVKATNGSIVRISSIGQAALDVRDRFQGGSFNGRPAILLIVFKQADANVIEVVDGIRALMPQIQTWMPEGITTTILRDRSETIRASVHDVERTLFITITLVIAVVAVFLRRVSSVLAAGASVPLSLLGTFVVMWLVGYSLDNLSLMALTISVGFVVDDAIVIIENIARLRERGLSTLEAAREGARQIGFTVLSITISLLAVFIPLLFMGGVVGRLFQEFSVTLAIAVAISCVISLTVTPVMAGYLAGAKERPPGWLARKFEAGLSGVTRGYLWSLEHVLRAPRLALAITLGLIGVTAWLYVIVPKGFIPDQDTGLITALTRAPPDTSFEAMSRLQEQLVRVVLADPAVGAVGSSVGGGNGNASVSQGRMFISLKPLDQRSGVSATDVVNRLRVPLARVGGVESFLRAVPDISIGGRAGGAQYQYVLLSPDLAALPVWTDKLLTRMRQVPGLTDLNSDQQRAGLVAQVVIDRQAAARLGVSVQAVTTALNNAFSQRQVSIIYRGRNQYRVIMEINPELQQHPEQLEGIYVSGTGDTQIPLATIARIERGTAALAVTKQSLLPASTITFNLAPGVSLGDASDRIRAATRELGLPDGMRTEFAGAALAFQAQSQNEPVLILAALLSIYIVLGMLYENLLHPLTIISTLPSAGIGALLALIVTGTPFTLIALIGVILLMGIVKKNAIMLVDFALVHQRENSIGEREAILEACKERFRPILMTTLAALFGAVPLAVAHGAGSELRQPLGVTIIGGLLLSQLITLYTTPVIYLELARLGNWFTARRRGGARASSSPGAVAPQSD